MNLLEVKNICKTYGSGETAVKALKDVSFSVPKGEYVAVVGESGSGKSTLLNMIGALDTPTTGKVLIDGKDIFAMDERKLTVFRRRNIGFIFQAFNLVPELTVEQNIIFPVLLDYQKPDKKYLEELLAVLNLKERRNHLPSQLSGGQQQRVALARAVVIEPSVLLFDEPLSNLDAKLRESMRDELRALQKRLGITSLYVTHDQSEAMAISDRVVIMKDGVICQQGTPTEIYEQPNSRFVANFIGKANFIDGTFRGMDGENALVEVGGHTFPIPAPGKMEGVQKDGPCCLAVRPESILLSEEEGPLPGRVSRATYYGAKVEYEVMLGDQPIIVEVYNPQLSKRFAEGEAVHMTLIDRCVRVLA